MSTAAPKRKAKASRKTKKSWRKNPDLEDVEDFLEDQRLDERLGLKDKSDDQLFVIDDAPETEEKADKELPLRLKRRQKPLKCFQSLENNSAVKDPVKNRNERRQKRNPVVVAKEAERQKQGIVKAKDTLRKDHRQKHVQKKKEDAKEKVTRRRTEFDFDLWGAETADNTTKQIKSDGWISDTAKLHNLNKSGRNQRKVPEDLLAKTTNLEGVEKPHAGTSYNPSFSDHQDLLWRASMVELRKEKEKHRIDFHTTKMMPDKNNRPTRESWIEEMSRGIPALQKDKKQPEEDEDKEEDVIEEGEENNEEKALAKPKTRKQRRKEREALKETVLAKKMKTEAKKHADIFRAKKIQKALVANELVIQANMIKRQQRKEAKLDTAVVLSGTKYEEPELDLKLSTELTGNLRSLKPEGNILQDRFKSMQKRNIIEARVKQRVKKNPKLRKKVLKRSHRE